jgi:hypothetical protein
MSPPLLTRHDVETTPSIQSSARQSVATDISMSKRGREGPKEPVLCPTDNEAILPKKKLNKQSWDYVIKSGVAGGLAGCSVSDLAMLTEINCLGKNRRRAARSCQDLVSNVESAVRKVFWLMAWLRHRITRDIPPRWHTRLVSRSFSNTVENISIRWHQVSSL